MKKGTLILLLFILSSLQHNLVKFGYNSHHMSNFEESTSAFIVTSDCTATFDQSINKSHSIAEVPIINTPASEQISLIEDFFQNETQFVEDLFLKIESLSPISIDYLKTSSFKCIISETAEYLTGCNFRL